MFKKIVFKSLPNIVAMITGGFLYFISTLLDSSFHDLFINIAAAFIAIPLLFLFYESAKIFSNRKLNKEITNYAKMLIDRELLSIILHINKFIFTLEQIDSSSEKINNILTMNINTIENQIRSNKYLGFQLYKNFKTAENAIHEQLKNPYILEKMEDDQIIALIEIVKSVRYFETIKKKDSLFIEVHEEVKGYKMISGKEINDENKLVAERYILLKKLDSEKYIVRDFGDIPKYNAMICLKYYLVNQDYLKIYSKAIYEIIVNINKWLKMTGMEFVIDTDMFKMRNIYINH